MYIAQTVIDAVYGIPSTVIEGTPIPGDITLPATGGILPLAFYLIGTFLIFVGVAIVLKRKMK